MEQTKETPIGQIGANVKGAMSEASVFSYGKSNENQGEKQLTARDFALRYLVGTVAVNFQNRNEHHTRVDAALNKKYTLNRGLC